MPTPRLFSVRCGSLLISCTCSYWHRLECTSLSICSAQSVLLIMCSSVFLQAISRASSCLLTVQNHLVATCTDIGTIEISMRRQESCTQDNSLAHILRLDDSVKSTKSIRKLYPVSGKCMRRGGLPRVVRVNDCRIYVMKTTPFAAWKGTGKAAKRDDRREGYVRG